MTSEDADLISVLSDRDVIALTLWGEARSEGPEGRLAVANVIRNRATAHKFGTTAREVCLWPYQFSCWMQAGGAENFGLVLDTARFLSAGNRPGPLVRECQWIAQGLLTDSFVDNTHGATHYLTASLYAAAPPTWAVSARVLAHIGNHIFLRAA